MTGNTPSTTLDDVNVSAPAPTAVAATPQSPPANVAPWAKRQLQVVFSPASGQSITLSGLRMIAQVSKASFPGGFNLNLRIQGMTLAHINTLSKAGTTYTVGNNKITVAAGDVGGQLSTVFVGIINYAYPDFQNQPDVA